MEESEEDRLFEKINEAIWAGDVETIKKCFPQIDKNDKQIQAELTWIVAKDVMKIENCVNYISEIWSKI